MIAVREVMQQKVYFEIGDGQHIKLFRDPWCKGQMFSSLFGHRVVRSMHLQSDAPVSSLIFNGAWSLHNLQSDNLVAVQVFLQTVEIKGGEDKLLWDDGNFNFKNAWKCVRHTNIVVPWFKLCWGRLSQDGLAVLMLLDRLPTMCNLQRRRVCLVSRCTLCQKSLDTTDHVFVTCPFSQGFWKWLGGILGWDLIKFQDMLTAWDLFNWMDNLYNKSKQLQILFAAGLWYIWRERNNRLHGSISLRLEVVARTTFLEVCDVQRINFIDVIV
ncbi:uncharacterized protein LOC132295812 [Cornus florida]|uniref:uncharacterized protein LOC132295812 n=1 Tax=Cornus florida TaxID=4283 RepID=UPI00289A6BC7|nr:uncharacterized protein LOC132295812 [Cornus florida]